MDREKASDRPIEIVVSGTDKLEGLCITECAVAIRDERCRIQNKFARLPVNVGIADQSGPILFDAGKRIIGTGGRRHTLSRVNGNDWRNLPSAQQVPLQRVAFYYARGHSGGVEVVSYVFGAVAAVRA